MTQSLVALVLYLLLGPVAVIWRGYVLSVLWAWFMVPLGMRPIGIALAIGLSLVASLLTGTAFLDTSKEHREPLENVLNAIAMAALVPALGLLIGWIVSGFIP